MIYELVHIEKLNIDSRQVWWYSINEDHVLWEGTNHEKGI